MLNFFGFRRYTEIINGILITYDSQTDIGRNLFFEGKFEKTELEICKKYLSEDSNIIDVGANIGIHSIFFASISSKGLVFSIEPSPSVFTMLIQNIQNFDNIIPLNIAASDKNKITSFFQALDDAYSGIKDTGRKKIIKELKVLSWRLDDLILYLNLNKIDLIKVDVEGWETFVLQGMEKTIENYRPIVFCEIYKGSNSNPDPDETINFLKNKNYLVFVLKNGHLTKFQVHDDKFYNYFFFPCEKYVFEQISSCLN